MAHDVLSIPKPPRIAKLPTWKGYPITFTTLVDADGKPDFKIVDSVNADRVKKEGLCGICGDKLDYWIAFIASPKEIEQRVIFDLPSHEDCARYALKACPWLFYKKAHYTDLNKTKPHPTLGPLVSIHPERDGGEPNARPGKMALVIVRTWGEGIVHDKALSGHFGQMASIRGCKIPQPKRIEWFEGV